MVLQRERAARVSDAAAAASLGPEHNLQGRVLTVQERKQFNRFSSAGASDASAHSLAGARTQFAGACDGRSVYYSLYQ